MQFFVYTPFICTYSLVQLTMIRYITIFLLTLLNSFLWRGVVSWYVSTNTLRYTIAPLIKRLASWSTIVDRIVSFSWLSLYKTLIQTPFTKLCSAIPFKTCVSISLRRWIPSQQILQWLSKQSANHHINSYNINQ